MHTRAGVADNFVNDVESVVAELMKNPEKPVEGKMAIYGVSQTIPDRSIVGDFTRLFLDSLLYTPKKPKKLRKLTKSDNKNEDFENENPIDSNDVTLKQENVVIDKKNL